MLSDRLTFLRKKHNKTQQQVAEYLGITRPAYTAYETGSRKPDYETIEKLADYYDVSVDFLFGREDQYYEEAERLYEKILELPEEKRKLALKLLDSMIDQMKE